MLGPSLLFKKNIRYFLKISWLVPFPLFVFFIKFWKMKLVHYNSPCRTVRYQYWYQWDTFLLVVQWCTYVRMSHYFRSQKINRGSVCGRLSYFLKKDLIDSFFLSISIIPNVSLHTYGTYVVKYLNQDIRSNKITIRI